jgi:hypothetical protein
MTEEKIETGTIVKYLLGALSEQEQTQVQERFLQDNEYFELLQAIEDDLIDDYIHKRLSREERKYFETNYLVTAERRKKVEFAADLAKTLSVSWWQALMDFLKIKFHALGNFLTIPRRPLRLAFAFTSIAVFIGGAWLMLRLQIELEQLKVERATFSQRERDLSEQVKLEQQRNEQMREELKSEKEQHSQLEQTLAKSPPSRQSLIAFVLVPDLRRAAEQEKRYVIPSGIISVQLQLDLESKIDYKSYRVAVETADGNELWSQDMLRPRTTDMGKAIAISLPTIILASDDYIIKVKGITANGVLEEVEEYFFPVLKR